MSDASEMTPISAKRTAYVLVSLLGAVAILHAYWALGGTWGLQIAVGAGNPLPPPIASAAVTFLLIGATLVVLGRVGMWGESVPAWLFRWGTWVLCVVLIAVAVMNFTTGRPWERWGFAPFAALLAALAAAVARSRGRAV